MRRAGIAALVVAGALAAPAGAAADWTSGDYRGATSQDYETRMSFSQTHMTRYGFELKMPCTKKRKGRRPARKQMAGRYTSGRRVRLRADGSFAGKFRGRGIKTSISGRVVGEEATGRFQMTYRKGGWTCRSPKLSWRVARIR